MKDKDLKKKISDMEAKKRAKAMAAASEINIINPNGDNNTITFSEWWGITNKKKDLKAWYKEVIRADFKGRGLGDRELKDKFDEALKLFGL